jgi:hypothetical protein
LASAAPFLCLIVLHLLWPDIQGLLESWLDLKEDQSIK